MIHRRFVSTISFFITLLLALSACNMPTATQPGATEGALPGGQDSASGMQVRFVNVSDGDSLQATMAMSETDNIERPLVLLQVEVTGGVPVAVTLEANGFTALDESNHVSEISNPNSEAPFVGEMRWSPLNGAGEYELVATAMDDDKQIAQATVHVTVTGVPAFTPTPPPLDQPAAVRRISEIIQQNYGVNIPASSVERFDFPNLPGRSRWFGSAFYNGTFYYLELFDDTHYTISTTEYANPAHRSSQAYYVFCKPAGLYKVLILFVDYGNVPGFDREGVLAQVPVMIAWVNQLYAGFTASQGLEAAPMRIEGDAAYIAPPPSPGNLLRTDEVRALTDFDPSAYDFVIEIDIDADNSFAQTHYPGLFTDVGGGLALQGCGAYEDPQVHVNIWSSLDDPGSLQGALSMDLTHEMSHLFGMFDNWAFIPQGLTLPNGTSGDDWIPYVMFGWTDTDGDGVIEILDPTPYGTSGPMP